MGNSSSASVPACPGRQPWACWRERRCRCPAEREPKGEPGVLQPVIGCCPHAVDVARRPVLAGFQKQGPEAPMTEVCDRVGDATLRLDETRDFGDDLIGCSATQPIGKCVE